MAAIRRCIRSRRLQRLGKVFFIVAVLACSIWRYVFKFPIQPTSYKLDAGNVILKANEATANGTRPAKSGALSIHMWRDLCGSDIPNLRKFLFFPEYPDEHSKRFIAKFQIVDNGVDYGERIFGFVHAPGSMSYRFAIASDDTSELWLSSSEDPNDKQLIARVFSEEETAWTNRNELYKYPDQISQDVKLRKGSKYYIEVLHKQGMGGGFVQVYWKSFQDEDFKLIRSEYLSPSSEDILVAAKKDVLHGVLSGRHGYEFERKSKRINKEHLKFYSLPLIPKDSYLPSCDYKSSLVLNNRVYQYEGVKFVFGSIVYPEDNTTMGDLGITDNWPNRVADRDTIQVLVDKIITSLRLKTSK